MLIKTKKTLLVGALFAAGMMALGMVGCLKASDPVAVVDLRCGGQVEPLGIDDDPLLLGWRIEGEQRGLKQAAYRVTAASSPELLKDGKADLWDSGKVDSDQSQWVEYAGKALGSAQRVFWQVEVWPAGGQSVVSEPSWFETGLLQPSDWQAKWIVTDPPRLSGDAVERWCDYTIQPSKLVDAPEWAQYKRDFLHENIRANAVVARAFDLDEVPENARLYLTARGYCEAWLNGQRIGDAEYEPTSGLQRNDKMNKPAAPPLYRTYDVTGLLKPGRNELRVILARGRLGGQHTQDIMVIDRVPELLLQLDAVEADGTRETLVATDATWKQAPGALLKESYNFGEVCDGRIDRLRRDLPEDDPAWKPVAVSDAAIDVEWNFCPPERVIRRVEAVDVFSPAEGVWIFDLGELISGTFEWREPKGMQSGDPVVFRIAQMLIKDGLDSPHDPSWYPEGTDITDPQRMISRGGRMCVGSHDVLSEFEKRHPDIAIPAADRNVVRKEFTPTDVYLCAGEAGTTFRNTARTHAFRYVEVHGLKEKPSPDQLAGLFIHTDVEKVGGFESANPAFNAFDERCRNVQLINTHGMLTDCWDGEKVPWNEDANGTGTFAFYVHQITGPLRKMSRDNRQATLQQGRPANFSSSYGTMVDAVWQSAMVKLPWYQYLYRGDLRSARETFDGIMKFLKFYVPDNTQPPAHNAWMPDWISRHHQSGRQRNGHEEFYQRTITPGLFYDLGGKVAHLARLLDRPEDAAWCEQMQQTMRRILLEEHWNAEKQTFGDNPEYKGHGTDSEDALIGAALKDDAEIRQMLADGLERQLMERDYVPVSGFVTFADLLDLMSDHDKADTIYRMFNREGYPGIKHMMETLPVGMPEWLYATAPYQYGSFSHQGFVLMSRWFYYGLGGLRADKDQPGFKHFDLRPQVPGELDHAAIWHQSPYGRIESAWTKENGKLVWNVTVPPNSTATAYVPAKAADAVTESGKPLAEADGVQFVKMEGDRAVCELQSGSYVFEVGE